MSANINIENDVRRASEEKCKQLTPSHLMFLTGHIYIVSLFVFRDGFHTMKCSVDDHLPKPMHRERRMFPHSTSACPSTAVSEAESRNHERFVS
ncbi:hypothetical protein QR680_000065 [Steinernema hermaphroditum]|uniref:Uncharacterized protein n=1 Tax=Steinernema hermaphroditum TaxID=289476 RepID=A0AA39LCW3_9BILA|nr:hypothetical protein QR680_000065 [Steinernema hermaphroditum]